MSSLYDVFSAFIAMLMSAAFLHFGATGDSRPAAPVANASHSAAASLSSVDTESDAGRLPATRAHDRLRHLSARSHCHGSAGAAPMLDTVRTPSPLRRS